MRRSRNGYADFVEHLSEDLIGRKITLLDAVHKTQDRYNYLPRRVLKDLSYAAKIPKEHLQSFTSFYSNLKLKPKPPIEVKVCRGLPCHLNGANSIKQELEEIVNPDRERHCLTEVSCLGLCDRAPSMMVNDDVHVDLDVRKVRRILEDYRAGRMQTLQETPPYQNLQEYISSGGYAMLKKLVKRNDPQWVIATLKASGLRGMGGAGFPVGVKWDLVRRAMDDEKFVVCNADEGEPGTFKDRVIMEDTPHKVLEGVLIAALTVGAKRSYIYVRDEYRKSRAVLEASVKELGDAGYTGSNTFRSSLDLDVILVIGAGSYVCGEETAMLESIEGKRGEPRLRPPYPATHGLWGKPTLINNVETLAWIPTILSKGAEWFKKLGRNGASGVRSFSLSGRVKKPGVYKLPLGLTVSELLYGYGGGVAGDRKVKAFVLGGISAGFLPGSMMNLPLDYDSVSKLGSQLGSAAVIVVADDTCMVALVENCLEFYANESCGKCTPCRVGVEKMLRIVRRMRKGEASEEDFDLVAELSEVMVEASLCGLGQTAPNSVLSAVKYFRSEFEEHIKGRCPSGTCFRV